MTQVMNFQIQVVVNSDKSFLVSALDGIVPSLVSASLFLQFCGILWPVLTHYN